MQIVEYNPKYENGVKSLMRELQEYIVELDIYKFNVIEKGYEDKYFSKTMNELDKNKGKMYLAIEDENVIGMACGIIKDEEHGFDYIAPKRGEVTELIVSKNSRSGGVGKKLLNKMEEYFTQNGCDNILIEVFGYNENAISFYKNNGYHTRMLSVSKKIYKD